MLGISIPNDLIPVCRRSKTMATFLHHCTELSFLLYRAISIQFRPSASKEKIKSRARKKEVKNEKDGKKTINLLMNHTSETCSELAEIFNQGNYSVYIS